MSISCGGWDAAALSRSPPSPRPQPAAIGDPAMRGACCATAVASVFSSSACRRGSSRSSMHEAKWMRRMGHVVVFAKAPRLGTVKRRLAAGIGALAALRFHRAATERLLRRLARDRRWHCWLALTPDGAARSRCFGRVPAARLAQGRGDLGRRMARPFRILRRGPVLVVGSDIPDVSAGHIAEAFRRLGSADFVFGPARDGGYWLFGARRGPLPRGFRIALAATLDDIDDAASLRRWTARSRSLNRV